MFKKLISLILVLLLCVTISGCGESNHQEEKSESNEQSDVSSVENDSLESDSNDSTASSGSDVVTSETSNESEEMIITHVAIQGAVITKQDGTKEFEYKRKCEACGYVSGPVPGDSWVYKSTSYFDCPECDNHQKVEIEHNWN